ncbi:MAG: AmmeMemoRadiSam system protein B, partial [Chloroflexota bacterium]
SVWSRAQEAVKACDLVLMFATDHKGGLGSLTLTKQPYQTPYGILPTDEALIDKLATAIGEDDAYRLELNHRHEHSVELSAVWLHHACPDNPPPMIPLLIGSFYQYIMSGSHPSKDPKMSRFLEALKAETAGKNVLCVASVDLSHVGPEFGDDYIMDQSKRDALVESDQGLIKAISEGDAARFYDEIAGIQDRNKVCGFSPVYLMLRYMAMENETNIKGYPIGYQHCAADAKDHSLVSICGMLLD